MVKKLKIEPKASLWKKLKSGKTGYRYEFVI